MNRKTVPVVILFICCAFGNPQNGRQFFYRKTTVDPISDFFSNNCDSRSATCVEPEECEVENFSTNNCANRAHICCQKQQGNNGGAIIFPENTSRHPAIKTTRKQTTTLPTKARTKSPTTTTTTEEPFDEEWLGPDCGIQQSIGTDTDDIRDSNRGEFPWNVEIYSKNKNDFGIEQNVFLCGGTLIDNFVVLTSGNCDMKNTSNLFVDVGVWNVEDINEKRQMRKVKKIIKHHQFQHTTRASSLALLVLDDPADFSRTVNRICLPEPDADLSDSSCFLTGWGGTGDDPSETIRPKMKVVTMYQLNHTDCQAQMRRTIHSYVLRDSFQCAHEESHNHVCPFDVGSPLICTIPGLENQFYQAGIFVWNHYVSNSGNRLCGKSSGVVNLFTNIRKFRRWIDSEMEKLERNINIYVPQLYD